jgi:hypothetical protein
MLQVALACRSSCAKLSKLSGHDSDMRCWNAFAHVLQDLHFWRGQAPVATGLLCKDLLVLGWLTAAQLASLHVAAAFAC